MAHRVGPRLRFLLWAPGLAALLVAIVLLAALLPYLTLDRRLLATLGLTAAGLVGVCVATLAPGRAAALGRAQHEEGAHVG